MGCIDFIIYIFFLCHSQTACILAILQISSYIIAITASFFVYSCLPNPYYGGLSGKNYLYLLKCIYNIENEIVFLHALNLSIAVP